MDCKKHIYDIIAEYGSVTLSFLMQDLVYHGIDRSEADTAISQLVSRGLVYRPSPETLEAVN